MKLLKNFLKDQLVDFAGYVGITILILFYYRLLFGKQADVIYPIFLAAFITLLVTFIKGIRYYRFHRVLNTSDYNALLLKGSTEEEKQVIRALEDIHKHYHSQIGDLVHEKEEAYALIAQMVHELKIPLSVIRLILEDSQEHNLAEDNKAGILRESDKLLNKLDQLLSFIRLGRFDRDFIIEKVNLAEEVRSAINLKKEYFILHKVFPRFDAGNSGICILTDKKWNGMLLDQIISNAVKYSALKEEGHVDFVIRNNEEYCELVITDYGIGIPEYDLKRIFESFFTGENGRKVKNSTGIGLYLCRMIADKLGHQLSITSVEGEMTQVTIRYLTKL